MREIIKEDNFVFTKIYNQLSQMNFSNFICSPLVNGGCGLGKTTALTDNRTYELFKQKTNKLEPQILFIESRSATRDQLKGKMINKNYHFYQFAAAAKLDLTQFDVVIVDEAHSLFMDSDFAARQIEPLARWLREALCFQIFITASDIEFLGFANSYFNNREFSLTFPDLNLLHTKLEVEQMVLSVSTKSIKSILEMKEGDFVKKGNKGLFFTLRAKDAADLCDYYNAKGYNCGFYISQQNSTAISTNFEVEDEEETLADYICYTKTISLLDYYHAQEKQRIKAGLPTIRQSLLAGAMPDDIDFLFITDTGREGLSIDNGHLDFIFIEDTIPLTINQKIFRYRKNLPLAYINLPQRRLEKIFINSLKQVQQLMNESQEFLRGYYLGSGSKKGKNNLEQIIVYNKKEDKYEVSQLYLSKLLYYSQVFNSIRENKDNPEFLKETYGVAAKNFLVEDLNKVNREKIIRDYFEGKEGLVLTVKRKERVVEDLREKGLVNEEYKKDYSFPYIMKLCREYNVCDFKTITIGKKHIKNDEELSKDYKKRALMIVPIEN